MNYQELSSILDTLYGSGNPADKELANQLANELGLDKSFGGNTLTNDQIISGFGTDIMGQVKGGTTGNNPGIDKATADAMASRAASNAAARAANPNMYGADLPAPAANISGLSPPSLGPNLGERASGVPAGGWSPTVSVGPSPGNYYGAPEQPTKGKTDEPVNTGWGATVTNVAGNPVGAAAPKAKDTDLLAADLPALYGITPAYADYSPDKGMSLVDPGTLSGYEPGGMWAGMDPLGGWDVPSGDRSQPGPEYTGSSGIVDSVLGRDKEGPTGNMGGNSGEGSGNGPAGGGGSSSGGSSGSGGAEGGSGQGGVGGVGEGGMGTGAGNDRRKGGPINKSGSYDLHKGEHVMNPEAVDIIGHNKLAKLNKFALKAKAGQKANKAGKNGPMHAQDTELAHVTPSEKEMLAHMSGGMKRNPTSDLPAFYDGDGSGDPGNDSTGGQGAGGTGSNSGDSSGDSGGAGQGGAGAGDPGGVSNPGQDSTGGIGAGSTEATGSAAGNMGGGEAYGGGGIGTTEAFGSGQEYRDWFDNQPAPKIYYVPAPEAPPSAAGISEDIDKRIKDLETYQPIAYQGDWLRYAMPTGTYGGAQHRFQRRTNDPVPENANVYAADLTYDTASWPNVPIAYGPGFPGQGIAGLTSYGPGQVTPLGPNGPRPVGPTGPYAGLKTKSGYGIMGLV